MKLRFELVEWLLAHGELSKPANDGWIWPAVIIRAGLSQIQVPGSKLPVWITREFIGKAAAHFEGAPANADHQEKGNVRAWVGNWKGVRAEADALLGELHLLKSEGWLREKLLAGQEVGGHQPGVSINAVIGLKRARRDIDGRGADVLEAQEPIPNTPRTADVVMFPAAGGKILKLAAGEDPEAALASAREQYQVLPADRRDNPGSAERSNEKGATMKETILRLLASLRALSLTEAAKTKVTAIEAELKRESPKFEELLAQAGDIMQEAAAAAAAAGAATPVAALQGEVKTLREQVAAAQEAQKKADWKLLLASRLTASKLPQPLQNRMRERLLETVLTAELLDAEIKAERDTYAALVPSAARASGIPAITLGLEGIDKLRIAACRTFGVTHDWERVEAGGLLSWRRGAAFDNAVPGFRSLKHLYATLTGDVEFSFDPAQAHLHGDITSTTFTNLMRDTMHRLLLQGYAEPSYGLDLVVPSRNRTAVTDFKNQERVRVGYFGDLPEHDPEVSEWPVLTAPTDERATGAVVQFGGVVPITRKAIKNDDLGGITQTVNNLGRTARRTLAQRVYNLMINNPATTYDVVTWAHASSHGANLRTTALSAAEIEVIAQLMYLQTEKDSGKTLGIEAAILIVPRQLQKTAKDLNEHQKEDAALNEAIHRFGANSERIITNPLFTDATDFVVMADQSQVPCIELMFMDGRQEPELFLADNPNEGTLFTKDEIRYKIRHEYEALITDHRGYAKNVVAG